MRIKLPICFYNDETSQLSDAGIEYDLSDGDVRDVIFYSISVIAPYLYMGKNWTTVYAGGETFICQLPMREVDKLINRQILIYSE